MRRPRRASRGRTLSTVLPLVAAGALASACTSGVLRGNGPAPATSTPPAAGAGSAAVTLITEPDQGLSSIYAFLSSPRGSLDMTMYELVDSQAESILAADAARGVDVRVVLDRNLEQHNNSPAFSYLSAHGVHVVWAPRSYDATHEKAVVVDARTALVMTLNLTSRYYSDTRDFAVEDADPADVAAIESVFAADYRGASSAATPAGADLVWSPGSQSSLVSLISSARSTLLVENEEMSDRAVVSALEAAAGRGVRVEVAMTDTGSYHSEFNALEEAGVAVHTYPDDNRALYIHAKAVVADGTRAFVGSENFTVSSLGYNRELGLITADPAVVRPLASTLAADFAGAAAWSG